MISSTIIRTINLSNFAHDTELIRHVDVLLMHNFYRIIYQGCHNSAKKFAQLCSNNKLLLSRLIGFFSIIESKVTLVHI